MNSKGQDPTAEYIINKLVEDGKIEQDQVIEYGEDTGVGIIAVDGEEIEIYGEIAYVNEDIFVALYNDGTLVFSNNEEEIDFSKVSTYYDNIKEEEYEKVWTSSGVTKVEILNKIGPTTMNSWFSDMFSLTEIKHIENINTSRVTDMCGLFRLCTQLTYLNLSTFNTQNVTNMSEMFWSCDDDPNQFEVIEGLDKWDTRNVEDMSAMFYYCTELTEVDVSHFNTEKVEDMSNMFHSCSSLTELEVGNFNTENVIYFNNMFAGCYELSYIDVSDFNTENAENMAGMFSSCSNLLEIDLSNFNTSKVADMCMMFSNCSSLESIDISSFDMSKNPGVISMFCGCSNAQNIYYSDTAKAISSRTFDGCTSLDYLYIPSSVITIDGCSSVSSGFSALNLPFAGCRSSTIIYCGASEKPSGWGAYWNYCSKTTKMTANFGYTRAQFEAIISE